jgi:chromosomal replication initiation ATPase DnaA
MSQIALPLDWPADEDQSDFLVTAANEHAVRHLDSWARWPVQATLLVGPRKSGKSLLGRIFAARSGGELIDDAPLHREEEVFHAWNRAQAGGGPILLVAHAAPPEWGIILPDLRSRITATPVIQLGPPDDELSTALLTKQLGRRGLSIAPDAASYVISRIARSHLAILQIVDLLDTAALSRQRAITIPFARDVLIEKGVIEG